MRTATARRTSSPARYGEALAWAEEVAWERPGFLIATPSWPRRRPSPTGLAYAERAMARLREIEPGMRLGNLRDHWPIRRPEDLARWQEGLRRAGLPS